MSLDAIFLGGRRRRMDGLGGLLRDLRRLQGLSLLGDLRGMICLAPQIIKESIRA